jgi:hypothetical protein
VRNRVAVDPEVIDAIGQLADAADSLSTEITSTARAHDDGPLAAQAARQATRVLDRRHDLYTTMVVGQVRAASVDLLRASGMEAAAAQSAIGSPNTARAAGG